MGIGREFIELMDKLNYRFSDISLLQKALTHISYSNEMKVKGFNAESFETLEFLGDAVLELVISDCLYCNYKSLGEGVLTKMRQNIVCESTLAEVGSGLALGLYLNVGNGEESLGIRNNSKVIADALEAVIAAVYVDSGSDLNITGKVIRELFKEEISSAGKKEYTDYKTRLLQFVEKNGDSVLSYEYLESGPEHNKIFVATAYINNNKVGVGRGKTKRAAETEAAKSALKLFGL